MKRDDRSFIGHEADTLVYDNEFQAKGCLKSADPKTTHMCTFSYLTNDRGFPYDPEIKSGDIAIYDNNCILLAVDTTFEAAQLPKGVTLIAFGPPSRPLLIVMLRTFWVGLQYATLLLETPGQNTYIVMDGPNGNGTVVNKGLPFSELSIHVRNDSMEAKHGVYDWYRIPFEC